MLTSGNAFQKFISGIPARLSRLLNETIQLSEYSVASSTSGVAILASGENASIAYILNPFLAAQGQSATCFDSNHKPPRDFAVSGCSVAIIVRYLPSQWIKPLRRFHANGGKLIYFMDDDLMDTVAIAGLPRDYARKVRKLALSHHDVLESLCSEFWVSSAYLAQKYRAWSPTLISPRASMSDLFQSFGATVCYHGTASHQAELDWLVPVIAAVQSSTPDTQFEVFGDHAVNKLYRDIPRVAILHPMSWPNYLSYTAAVRRDIALAPLLPGPFNAARGPTKFFDFARMSAVGIYTDIEPYRSFIHHGVDGYLLPNDPDLWAHTIMKLAGDEHLRSTIAQAARQRAMDMALNVAETMESPC